MRQIFMISVFGLKDFSEVKKSLGIIDDVVSLNLPSDYDFQTQYNENWDTKSPAIDIGKQSAGNYSVVVSDDGQYPHAFCDDLAKLKADLKEVFKDIPIYIGWLNVDELTEVG
ncbi:MAG: hypothetical protein PHQ00_05435 [Phycisphaerae bacterium]|nr:hypothetical protein [Phycisphaerae bacterium]